MRFFLVLAAVGLLSCEQKSGGGANLKDYKLNTLEEKVSYVYGQQIGREMKNQGLDISVDILTASIREAVEGKKPRMEQKDMQAAMRDMQKKMREKRQKEATENLEKGKKFLADNKSKEGIQTTESGLQYKVVKVGAGKKPAATDVVKVHYKGTLTDGTEFDSSYKRGEPAEFPLNRVIKGWTEGLQLMPVGSKYQFYIPSQLAYGPQARPTIPANSVLVFDVELLSIVEKKEDPKKDKKGG